MPPKFPELEEKILADWKKKDIFKKTLKQSAHGQRFVFFEGPPTANGKPGIHHVLARIFKDLIPRFKTMQGYRVERKAGWDTQGLPVELEVEKKIGVSGKRDIEKYGIDKFNQACRESVWKYKKDWEELTERIGFWLDLEHPYITYQNGYIETLWWIFKQIWDKKLLFKDYKVVPHCPRCETALSSHEVAQGYEKIKENSVYIKFKITHDKGKVKKGDYILSWTTTPWTLPGNVALAVGKDIDYALISNPETGERIILAKNLLKSLKLTEANSPVDIKGLDLVGLKYEPLFDAIPKNVKNFENAYKVYAANFVSTDDGTGVVHTAVMYGEDDYRLGQEVGLPKHHTVTSDGYFIKEVKDFAGQYVKDKQTEQAIIESLRQRNLLYKEEMYEHDYPFCWRCHSPLLYYAKDSWFIKMSSLREELKQNNEQINWIPEYIKPGRFGEWLDEVKDWAISRERYWGTPIPIWTCSKCGHQECVGSFSELAEKAVKQSKKILSKEFDPHRPFIDEIGIKCQCGSEMRRIPEVADTWFDSGSMPFAQWHYPFENKERIDQGENFPADFIAEAIDQTRGWFYTLLAISTALGYKNPPYKNVICLGHILDAKGQKMSKHIGNVIDPWEVIKEYGSDAIRWYLFTLNQPGDYKLFDKLGVNEVVKKNFLILWNVLTFYRLYQETEKVQLKPTSKNIMDRWILAKLNVLVDQITKLLENYKIIEAGRTLSEFITELSTWYLRRSRERFKSEVAEERDVAIMTLGYVIQELSKLLAPFIPLFAEGVYQEVGGKKESVHLEAWPKVNESLTDEYLLREMEMVRQVTELTHAARAEASIKVRQPLSQLVIRAKDFRTELIDILKAEVNVRDIFFRKELPRSADWQIKEAGELAVALDTTVTDELYYQGFIRDTIRQINNLRKQTKLTIKNRIEIYFFSADSDLNLAVEQYTDWIKRDTLSDKVIIGQFEPNECLASSDLKIENKSYQLGLKKLS